MVTKQVQLQNVTKDDAQSALDAIEEIFDEYGLPDPVRLQLWEHFQVFATDVLIRFGEFNPDVGYPEHNGH